MQSNRLFLFFFGSVFDFCRDVVCTAIIAECRPSFGACQRRGAAGGHAADAAVTKSRAAELLSTTSAESATSGLQSPTAIDEGTRSIGFRGRGNRRSSNRRQKCAAPQNAPRKTNSKQETNELVSVMTPQKKDMEKPVYQTVYQTANQEGWTVPEKVDTQHHQNQHRIGTYLPSNSQNASPGIRCPNRKRINSRLRLTKKAAQHWTNRIWYRQ